MCNQLTPESDRALKIGKNSVSRPLTKPAPLISTILDRQGTGYQLYIYSYTYTIWIYWSITEL